MAHPLRVVSEFPTVESVAEVEADVAEQGDFETNTDTLKAWLKDPPAEKPGSWMPNYHLTPDQIDALTAYLESLK